MDKISYHFEQLLEQAKELPPHLKQQLIEALQTEDDVVVTAEEIREWRSGKPMTGKQMVEAGLYGGWEDRDDLADSATAVRKWRSNTRP